MKFTTECENITGVGIHALEDVGALSVLVDDRSFQKDSKLVVQTG